MVVPLSISLKQYYIQTILEYILHLIVEMYHFKHLKYIYVLKISASHHYQIILNIHNSIAKTCIFN